MDSGEMQYLFKETRLNLEPPAATSVVNIRVPSKTGLSRSPERRIAYDSSTDEEATFRTKNLASASSIYHRKWNDSPRSFLWRVLEDDSVLSIRVVDVCKKDKTADTPLVLNFNFGVPIQPGCVAFSDPEEHDALCIFVLDQSSQLFTFTLRPDFFRKRTALDAVLSELCKVQSPAGLSFKSPHRLVAVTANILLVAVSDGGLIRLDKTRSDDSSLSVWKESFFNVQGWAQNLRSLLPFQGNHTIKYGKVNMEYSAATSIQVTSLGLERSRFAITVCLDHRIRIWNIDDGQILFTKDLLNMERGTQDVGKWAIDPSQANLVQLVGRSRGQRICATYSPVGAGEFKFWKVVAKDAHTIMVEDLFPKATLIPSTPSSSDIWTLADFVLASPTEGSINLWTLWKNNLTYRVKRLELDRNNMAQSWEENWDGVLPDAGVMPVQTSGPCDPTDVTEKWLECILQPGRFTKATLETTLCIYERGLGSPKDSSKGRGLAEAICSVLGATASLDRDSSGTMDYEQFRGSSETQWRRFFRLLMELDRQRGEAVGLAFDAEADIVWVVCTDLVSAIRQCSDLERLYHNLASVNGENSQKAALISAAVSFVGGFSDNYVQVARAALRQELFEESSRTDLERIQHFSDKAGFWRGITDDDCAQITETLGANFAIVDDDLYARTLDLIAAPAKARSRHLRHPLTEFGQKLITKGLQDDITLQWNICFSQLILLTHMEFEFDNEEDALHNRVNIGPIFRRLLAALKRLELLKWLAHTELSVPLGHGDRALLPPQSKKNNGDSQTVTALEANLGHLLGFDDVKKEPLFESITDLLNNLCAPDSDIEVSPALIQCALIKQGRADLALDLVPFSDQNPFSVYVLGRIQLSLNDFGSAAISFRRAAIGMGTKSMPSDRHSCGLLGDTEWNLLNSGQAMYYSHIVALYEAQKAYSYVVDFARLSIQFLEIAKEEDYSSAKIDMLGRLFNAALATSQYEVAYTSLLSIHDEALKQSSLRKLIAKMCETHHNMELVSLPFPGLQQDVDDILAAKCRNTADVVQGFPYHQVLYSWRIKRNNYRGAASVLLDRIQKLKLAGEGDKITGEDMLDTPVTRQYLLLINALSCVDPKQAWIFDEGSPALRQNGDGARKRKVVSLAEVRKQYQDELDRIAAIQNNQFGFETSDAMEL
ncbi:hypothetical protein E4U55_004112 [Claviceps digitariae]|nr:hypothetical protein E4U55_004112 [Claviceps digitariae]